MDQNLGILSKASAPSQRLFRAAMYGIIAYCLLYNQTYYQFSYFLMALAVFGLGLISCMRWVALCLVFLFLMHAMFPNGMTWLEALYVSKLGIS